MSKSSEIRNYITKYMENNFIPNAAIPNGKESFHESWVIWGTPAVGVSASCSDDVEDDVIEFGVLERTPEGDSNNLLHVIVVLYPSEDPKVRDSAEVIVTGDLGWNYTVKGLTLENVNPLLRALEKFKSYLSRKGDGDWD